MIDRDADLSFSFDVGRIPSDRRYQGYVEIVNQLDDAIDLTNIGTSCGCLVAVPAERTVDADDSQKLYFTLASMPAGRFEQATRIGGIGNGGLSTIVIKLTGHRHGWLDVEYPVVKSQDGVVLIQLLISPTLSPLTPTNTDPDQPYLKLWTVCC